MRMERIARTARASRFRRTSPFSRQFRVQRTPRSSRGSRIQRTSRGSRTPHIQRTSRGSRTSRYSLTSGFLSAPRYTHVRRVRSRCGGTLRSGPMRSAMLTPATAGRAAPADGLQGEGLRQRLGVPRRHLSILHLSAISSSPPTRAHALHLLSPPSRPRAQASSTLNRTQLHR
jgi:hypothetical protein